MKIKDKVMLDIGGLYEHGPITIVAFGDSVTHGCFDAELHDIQVVSAETELDEVCQKIAARL